MSVSSIGGRRFVVAAAGAVVSLAAAQASAVQIVTFGGEYVAVNANFRRLATNDTVDVGGVIGTTDARAINAFSTATPLSPSSGYTGPTFYGGYQTINFDSATAPTYGRQQVNNSGTADRIGVVANALDVNGGRMNSAIVFLKSDFLNGGSSGTVSFSPGDSLTLTDQNLTGGATERFLVLNGSNYFVSGAVLSATGTLTIDPATTTFAPYTPGTNLNFDQTQAFATQTFNNVQGVGYYLENDVAAAAATPGSLALTFTANATVPEPATAGFLAVAGVGLLARRRRR